MEIIKEHISLIFIGHIDSGKSTLGGHVFYLLNGIDKGCLILK